MGHGIRLVKLLIRTGQVDRLKTSLQALQHGNADLGFLQESKLTQGINTRHGKGYDVWSTEAESWHQGGVVVVLRAAKGWQVKGTASFVPNVVSFLLMLGTR